MGIEHGLYPSLYHPLLSFMQEAHVFSWDAFVPKAGLAHGVSLDWVLHLRCALSCCSDLLFNFLSHPEQLVLLKI